MNGTSLFAPRFLSAPEYVFALHKPNDSTGAGAFFGVCANARLRGPS